MDDKLIISPRYGGDDDGGSSTVTPPINSSTSSSNGSSESDSNGGSKLIDNNLGAKIDSKLNTNDKANVNMTEYNYDGITVTENPTMSFFEAQTQYATPKEGRDMVSKFSGIPSGLDKLPPSYYNNVVYPHRKQTRNQMNSDVSISRSRTQSVDNNDKDDSGYFKLGTTELKIPPEFITVNVKSGNTSIPTMRSSSSLITKSAYADREIMVNLVLNGLDQINGYKVESPFDYPYYVDGLREILGQFKYTPFVPVTNIFLNVQHNIHTVALSNITVETIEGFPETLNVTLTLKEFNSMAYTQNADSFFGDNILWPLFDFYIQRQIRDKKIGFPMIKTPHLTNKIVFKVLKEDVFSNDNIKTKDLLDDKNYEVAVDSESLDLHLTKLTFSVGNKMPKIQMSYHESPTYQFMGGTDTHFLLQFETNNKNAITQIQAMNSNNLAIVRQKRQKNSVGFIKIENELINLSGTSHIVINDINSSTVPGFPGLYTISISGTSFDCGAKDREKFLAMRPFYDTDGALEGSEEWLRGREGERKDLRYQGKEGLSRKVTQDACIESKLQCIELYPDLRLPKYSAVDWALSKIQAYRLKNNLEPLPFTKLPRPKCHIPGKGAELTEYNGYVDPDFWMLYPSNAGTMDVQEITDEEIIKNYTEMNKSLNSRSRDVSDGVMSKLLDGSLNPVKLFSPLTPTIEKIVEPEYVPGYEPDQQLRFHWGNIDTTNSDDELIDKLNSWVKASATGTVSTSGTGTSGGSFNGVGEPTDPSKTPKQVSKVTGNPFVDLLINRATSGCGYLYGASQYGDKCTQELIDKKRKAFGGSIPWDFAKQWIGKQVWDCSSFVCWGLIQIGLKPKTFKITSGSWGPQGENLGAGAKNLKVGDLLYGGGHIVVYIGNNKVVHASSTKRGCKVDDATSWINNKKKCHLRCRLHGLEEACNKFLKANPNFYLEDSVSSNSSNDTNSNSNNTNNGGGTGNTNSSNINSDGRPMGSLDTSQINSDGRPVYTTGRSRTNSSASTDDFTTGEPVIGKFGSDPIFVQLLDSNKQEKSSKNRFVGSNADRFDDIILKHSKTYNLDPNFIKTMMMIESGGNPNCTSSSAPCKGLLQLHQTYFKISDPYDPDQNIEKGCEVLYKYGSYKNPLVAFDKKKWIACYNRGPNNLKKQLAGTSPEPVETLNYYRKFDAFYSRLVASGGKPGATITALEDGKVPPASWYENQSTGSGSSSNTTITDIDIDVKVWFEKGSGNELALDTSKLKNPNAGKLHSTAKVLLNIAKVGLLGPGAFLVSTIANVAENFKPNSKMLEYPLNIDKSKAINVNYVNVKPKAYQHEAYNGKDVNELKSRDIDTKPTPGEFGIGLIDSLSDGALNFDNDEISKIEDFKNDKEILERMFVDMNTYSQRGRLSRAFPSYMFLIIDEHQGWVDNQQFWSNYYLYQSVLEIDIHEADDMPISTAKVSLSNTGMNLRKYVDNVSMTDQVMGPDGKIDLFGGNDSDYSTFEQLTYLWFGSIIDERVTDDMIAMRNKLYETLFLREGYRIHIRLGYGSNPANYAHSFSGTIVEIMDGGDTITLAAQSDGAELVGNIISDRTNATNKDVNLPSEPSDIIAALLCDRQNEFLYQLTGGRAFIENKHGIMHFGYYSSGKKEGFNILTDTDNGKNVFRKDAMEYDIIKNVYKANYRGEYIYEPNNIYFVDGEKNMGFFCYNRTPWDIMKMCEKMNPEFIAYPRPFGMEYRLFYGLPHWQHKYRYERDDKNNTVYEMSKAFSQFNMVNSYQDIIDNRMRIDTTGLVTNMIGIYTLGGDLASTPVIMSDSWIDRNRQKTKTIDTTSVQNFKGLPTIVDKFIEWSGAFDNGKHNAINVCISELIASWKSTYAGELMVIGAPEIRPWNYLYISDLYVNMEGMCQVREVVHSLSGDRGFVTTIIPGLIATNTMKQSASPVIIKSAMQIGKSQLAYIGGYYIQAMAAKKIGSVIAAGNFATAVTKLGPKASSFLIKGTNIISALKQGKFVASIGSIIANAKTALTTAKNGSKILGLIWKILSGVGSAGAGVGAAVLGSKAVLMATASIIATFVIGSIINRVLTSLFDTWSYTNVINIHPLYLEGSPWVGGATGQRKLYSEYTNGNKGEENVIQE